MKMAASPCKQAYLLLQSKNMGDTTINRVMESSLSFIRDCDSSFRAVVHWELSEELRNIACPKDFVNYRKMGRTLFVAEIRGKYTTLDASPPQEFACSTGRSTTWSGTWTRPRHIDRSISIKSILVMLGLFTSIL